jgi:hypothetical protein
MMIMITMMTVERSIDRRQRRQGGGGRKEERGEAMASEIDSPTGPERSGKEDEEKFPSDETGTSGEVAATTNNKANDARRRTRTTAGSSRKDEEEDDNGGGAAWYEYALDDVNHADCPGRTKARRPTFRFFVASTRAGGSGQGPVERVGEGLYNTLTPAHIPPVIVISPSPLHLSASPRLSHFFLNQINTFTSTPLRSSCSASSSLSMGYLGKQEKQVAREIRIYVKLFSSRPRSFARPIFRRKIQQEIIIITQNKQ